MLVSTTILIECPYLYIVTLGMGRLTTRPSHKMVDLKISLCFNICIPLMLCDVYPYMIDTCTYNLIYKSYRRSTHSFNFSDLFLSLSKNRTILTSALLLQLGSKFLDTLFAVGFFTIFIEF